MTYKRARVAGRLLNIAMVLLFVVFTIIGSHYLMDDLRVTAATSERTHAGDPFFIVLDLLCVIACVAGVALFTSVWLASKQSSTSNGLWSRRWIG